MVKLGEVYSSVENPLDNEEMLKKIVSFYSKSDRTNLIGSSNLYSSLVKMNQSKDNSHINLDDRESFFVETYNQWIENMLSLDGSHIQYLKSSIGMDARQMQQYLRSFGKVSSMEDISRLKSSPLFDEEINSWELNDGWEHIKSQYISGRTESKILVKHRLYIGCQNRDMWKLAQLFKSKCEAQRIPFYFKLASSSDRDDKIVIYADTDNLGNYISALQEIAQEHPKILQRCGKPPALTGKIDGWIGIGDEPSIKENGEKQSYNTLRADIFENAIEEALLSDISDFKGKDVVYSGKQTRFNDLFMEQAAETILTKLDKCKGPKLSDLGLKEADLVNERFKEHIKAHLRKKVQIGLDKLFDVKDIKNQLAGSNGNAIFTIPTRDGKSIPVNTYDMDAIIKGMVPIMQQVDSTFMDRIKSQIQEKCKQNGIDDTFCFQQGTKERFEQVDSAQSAKIVRDEMAKTTQTTKKEISTQSAETEKVKTTTSVSSIDIINNLNPELMKRKVKLPNGVKIPATQYIQEVVAPHIPSDGKFILKSNGLGLSAKQFIEEVVMFEGQEKYHGDINALLEAMTVANNGTISIGTRIKSPRGQGKYELNEKEHEVKHKWDVPHSKKKSSTDPSWKVTQDNVDKNDSDVDSSKSGSGQGLAEEMGTTEYQIEVEKRKHEIGFESITSAIEKAKVTDVEVSEETTEIKEREELAGLQKKGWCKTAEEEKRYRQLKTKYEPKTEQQKRDNGIHR